MADKGLSDLLRKHKHVPFVKRMLSPGGQPTVKNPDGTVSSHMMSSAEVDGKHFAYPTLRKRDGRLVRDDDPMSALKSKNVIYFDTSKAADEFARGSWKKYVPDEGEVTMPYGGMSLTDGKSMEDSLLGSANLKFGIDKGPAKKLKPVGDGALSDVISKIVAGGEPSGMGIAFSLAGGVYDMVTADRPQIDQERLDRARAAGDWYDWEY